MICPDEYTKIEEQLLTCEKTIHALQERVNELEGQILAFFTGVVPENNASLATIILAQYGRQRLEKVYGDSVNVPVSVIMQK